MRKRHHHLTSTSKTLPKTSLRPSLPPATKSKKKLQHPQALLIPLGTPRTRAESAPLQTRQWLQGYILSIVAFHPPPPHHRPTWQQDPQTSWALTLPPTSPLVPRNASRHENQSSILILVGPPPLISPPHLRPHPQLLHRHLPDGPIRLERLANASMLP